MTVYVDEVRVYAPSRIRCFQNGSAHLTADTLDELHAFAGKLGLRRAWFQASPPASVPHYDLSPGRWNDAITQGAVLVPARVQAKRRLAARTNVKSCPCTAKITEHHDARSSWLQCEQCGAMWDLRDESARPGVAARLSDRCCATETATDGPVPYEERCIFVKKHNGRHECAHGFHWR